MTRGMAPHRHCVESRQTMRGTAPHRRGVEKKQMTKGLTAPRRGVEKKQMSLCGKQTDDEGDSPSSSWC
jgi:hypothetical protein